VGHGNTALVNKTVKIRYFLHSTTTDLAQWRTRLKGAAAYGPQMLGGPDFLMQKSRKNNAILQFVCVFFVTLSEYTVVN